jgi:hypothetical protein
LMSVFMDICLSVEHKRMILVIASGGDSRERQGFLFAATETRILSLPNYREWTALRLRFDPFPTGMISSSACTAVRAFVAGAFAKRTAIQEERCLQSPRR